MNSTITLLAANGEPVEIEVREAPPRPARVARGEGEIAKCAAKTFDDAIDRVKPLANTIVQRMMSLDVTPEEVEVKFGLKFTAEANVILSATTAEANLEFTLKWKPRKPPAPELPKQA